MSFPHEGTVIGAMKDLHFPGGPTRSAGSTYTAYATRRIARVCNAGCYGYRHPFKLRENALAGRRYLSHCSGLEVTTMKW